MQKVSAIVYTDKRIKALSFEADKFASIEDLESYAESMFYFGVSTSEPIVNMDIYVSNQNTIPARRR